MKHLQFLVELGTRRARQAAVCSTKRGVLAVVVESTGYYVATCLPNSDHGYSLEEGYSDVRARLEVGRVGDSILLWGQDWGRILHLDMVGLCQRDVVLFGWPRVIGGYARIIRDTGDGWERTYYGATDGKLTAVSEAVFKEAEDRRDLGHVGNFVLRGKSVYHGIQHIASVASEHDFDADSDFAILRNRGKFNLVRVIGE